MLLSFCRRAAYVRFCQEAQLLGSTYFGHRSLPIYLLLWLIMTCGLALLNIKLKLGWHFAAMVSYTYTSYSFFFNCCLSAKVSEFWLFKKGFQRYFHLRLLCSAEVCRHSLHMLFWKLSTCCLLSAWLSVCLSVLHLWHSFRFRCFGGKSSNGWSGFIYHSGM